MQTTKISCRQSRCPWDFVENTVGRACNIQQSTRPREKKGTRAIVIDPNRELLDRATSEVYKETAEGELKIHLFVMKITAIRFITIDHIYELVFHELSFHILMDHRARKDGARLYVLWAWLMESIQISSLGTKLPTRRVLMISARTASLRLGDA